MLCSGYKCGAALLLLSAALAGCAGNGDGLDANGQPPGSGGSGSGGGSGGISADFQSIQDNVFTPICTQCHIGTSAPEGLQLDSAHSYQLLVGVPSNEKPSLQRIKPGDPDNSYMLQKLEGAPGIVGGQMPLGQQPLPQSTLTAIRQWIANGAMQASATSPPLTAKLALRDLSATSETFAITVTAPLDGDDILAPLSVIVVAFNHEVDASLVNSTTLTLEALDGGAPRTLAATASLASSNPSSIVLRPAVALTPGEYRVTVRGTGGGALADIGAQTLGADFSFIFTVSPAT
jgi:hypothetical protein